MNNREIKIMLLTFAISSIIWCGTWAYMLGKVNEYYQAQIYLLTQ